MKLLIVDDDEQIRSGIEQGIDWDALGIHQVITAANGIEAWQSIVKDQPEIVITDVRMPGMDGLELLAKIKAKHPHTKVIILSGYNEFEYLKKAIQLGAVDYEMKPIRARSLIALVHRLKEDIIRKRVSEQEYNKYVESYKANFVEDLLSGEISDRLIILEGLEQYFSFDATGSLICISIQVDRIWNKPETIQREREILDYIQTLFQASKLSEFGSGLRPRSEQIVLLLSLETSSYLYYLQTVNELINRFKGWNREVQALYQTSFSAGISGAGHASRLAGMYKEANLALELKFYEGKSSFQIYDKSLFFQEGMIIGLQENSEFISMLSRGEFSSVAKLIEAEYECLKQHRKYSKKYVLSYSCNLLQFLVISIKNITAYTMEYIQSKIGLLEENAEFLFIDDMKEMIMSVVEYIGQQFARSLSPVMIRAQEFIHQHYMCELSVDKVADYIGKTPNYFSHLFKREFGISFKEYVTRLRIEKAKELIIHSNDLIYEISEQVGFSDHSYFTQVFKKIEGYAPTELRR